MFIERLFVVYTSCERSKIGLLDVRIFVGLFIIYILTVTRPTWYQMKYLGANYLRQGWNIIIIIWHNGKGQNGRGKISRSKKQTTRTKWYRAYKWEKNYREISKSQGIFYQRCHVDTMQERQESDSLTSSLLRSPERLRVPHVAIYVGGTVLEAVAYLVVVVVTDTCIYSAPQWYGSAEALLNVTETRLSSVSSWIVPDFLIADVCPRGANSRGWVPRLRRIVDYSVRCETEEQKRGIGKFPNLYFLRRYRSHNYSTYSG